MNSKHQIRNISSLLGRELERGGGQSTINSGLGTESAMTDICKNDKITIKQPSCLADLSLAASPEKNHSPLTTHHSPKRKLAFTLAEVLITLGIIGIVAVLTLPNLIEQHEKKVTAVKLEKFYTVMSQAVILFENKEGIEPENFEFPQETVRNGRETKIWYDNNLKPFVNQDTEVWGNSDKYISSKLVDGSGFVAYITSPNIMYFFYCTQFKYCKDESYDGRRTFLFSLINGKFFASHNQNASSRSYLLDKCKNPPTNSYQSRHWCTKLIQYDGWQIKDDYPWREE